jgi:3-methyladenine DNA glycosylase AlkD
MNTPFGKLGALLLACTPAVLAGCKDARKVDYSVPSLRKTLREDKDPNMRYYAAQSLGHFGPEAKAAVPDLIEALKDEDKMVRMGAGYALAEIGPDAADAVPALQDAAKDPEKEVRDAAEYALKQIGRKGKKR